MSTHHHLQTFLNGARVSPSIFQLRPDYRALLIAVDGIRPAPSNETSETLLQDAEASARSELAQHPVTEVPHIASWREAYKSFGAKPQKTRNSLEALMRRTENGLPRVNRLTDIYNALSVKHRIPFGGEDLNKYSGSPFLIRATGTETFETVASGEKVIEHPLKGEVVWCDDAGVTCRIWNYRQGPRTALTDETTSALFILDALNPITNDNLKAAGEELISALKGLNPDVDARTRMIDASTADPLT